MPVVISAAELNQQNEIFWRRETELMQCRLQKPVIAALAFDFINSEGERLIPMRYRMGLEFALQEAEKIVQHLAAPGPNEAARRAGSARKGDPLTRLIRDMVQRQPDLSESQLCTALEAQAGHPDGIIIDIGEDRVWFKTGKNTTKEASISSLKDRLSRAKKDFLRAKSR